MENNWISNLGLGSVFYYEVNRDFRIPITIIASQLSFGDKRKNRDKIDLAIRNTVIKHREFFSPIPLNYELLKKTSLSGKSFIQDPFEITSFTFSVGGRSIGIEKIDGSEYKVTVYDTKEYEAICTSFSDLQVIFERSKLRWYKKEKLFPKLVYVKVLPNSEFIFVRSRKSIV